MPNRHLHSQKSRSSRSSTSTKNPKHKRTQRNAREKRRRKLRAARASQIAVSIHRLELGKTVIADMLGDPSLSFTAAARKWEADPRWLRKTFSSEFEKTPSGRIRAKVRNARHKILYQPTATPGMAIPVVTKNKRDRLLLGEWMAALNEAGRGDWSRMGKFPKGRRIGGVLLETDPDKVQEILEALAEEESPFEGMYRTIARPS